MKKEKREKKVFLASIALVILTVLTLYVVSTTYAKYVSSMNGTSTARVAKWAWKINNSDLTSGSATFNLNLFDTVLDTDISSTETNVKKGTSEHIIAPGTSGEFKIKVENKSEVNATYKYTLSQNNPSNIPIEYSTDKSAWTSNIQTLNAAVAKNINMGAAATDATIYWRWAIGDGSTDATDTAIGFNGTANITVTATLELKQVD